MAECTDDLAAALGAVDALLPMEVYQDLFDTVAAEKPRTILEIGTAHGGGSIAMALGAKSVGHSCKVFTVDTLEALPDIPSSRAKWGDVEANRVIVEDNFKRAGVAQYVQLFVGRSDVFADTDTLSTPIDMLVLDADGRIDRDLLLFCANLRDGARVVIDDVDGDPKLIRSPNGRLLDLKHVISKKLLGALIEAGFLSEDKRVRNTAFCTAIRPEEWQAGGLAEVALSTYRELVFLDVSSDVLWQSFAKPMIRQSPIVNAIWPLLKSPSKVLRRFK